jgi:maleate isomerase
VDGGVVSRHGEPAPPSEPVRVGLLVPSSNTVMEVDFYRRLPASATLHTGRMYLETTTPEAEGVMLDQHVVPTARDLATARPAVLVFGCTSAGALRGNDYDRELCLRLAAESGAEVVSVIASVRRAIARRGSKTLGVVTPYVDALNEKIRSSLEADGSRVSVIDGLGITDNFRIAQVTPEEIAEFAFRRLHDVRADLVFISCTNFRALEAIPLIEERLGTPVVTSNQAALEETLALLGALGTSGAAPIGAASQGSTD